MASIISISWTSVLDRLQVWWRHRSVLGLIVPSVDSVESTHNTTFCVSVRQQQRRAMRFWLLMAVIVGLTRVGAMDFPAIRTKAHMFTGQSYVPPVMLIPVALLHLNYDQHRAIMFRPEQMLWQPDGRPFQIKFIHPGWVHNRTNWKSLFGFMSHWRGG